MLKQVQHDIFHLFTNYDTVSDGERGRVRGASGYKLGILVNFSKGKVEYRRVLIRQIRYH